MADSLQTEIAVEGRLGQSAAPPLTITSDALLVTRAQNGEQLAYMELCSRHRDLVFRTVLRITRKRDDAEDILQDSWMRAFAHIGTFDGRSAFSTWVTKIAINSALTMIRRRRTRRELSLDAPVAPDSRTVLEILDPSRNPEESYLETERVRLVRQAIKRLPSKLRTAIELHQSQDGSMSELAMLVGVSVPAMKSRLVRARLQLREPLSNVMKGRSTSDASQRANEGGTAQRKLRRQDRSKDVVLARRVAYDLLSDAGGADGQSIAN
jgi:RNA polymerase sigma factor (sigma-70 family)